MNYYIIMNVYYILNILLLAVAAIPELWYYNPKYNNPIIFPIIPDNYYNNPNYWEL
jgi:hypothetical protein